MATSGATSLQTMMKISSQIQQSDPVDAAPAEARAQSQALAVQRMREFLDSLPREPTDPRAPPLTQNDINALVQELRS